MSFYFKNQVLPYFAGATPSARKLHAFDYMYWTLMQRASERNCEIFDFGRSKFNTGAFAYKAHWGFEAKPLQYQYALLGEAELPDVNPTNPKYSRKVDIWRSLPLWATRFAGPYIARQLG